MAAQDRMEIPHGAFFGVDEMPLAFQGLLRDCMQRSGTLAAAIGPASVTLSVRDKAGSAGEVQLRGAWRSPDFNSGDFDTVASKLFLPFLFRPAEIHLPHSRIYTLGHGYRSLADFFTRNLFLSICRDEPIGCTVVPLKEGVDGGVGDLQRQYFYILKAMCPEPVLEELQSRDAIDFIQANAYLPVVTFENRLLSQGGRALREACLQRGGRRQIGAMQADLQQARARIMTHYGT